MIIQPFEIFRQFSADLDVRMLTKEDSVKTDGEARVALEADIFATVDQPHGNVTVLVDEELDHDRKADGMLTDTEGVTLAARAADCQLIVAYDPYMKVIGVVHVGWRCLVAGTIHAFLSKMSIAFKVAPSKLYIGVGPSLCMKCAEFTDPVKELKGIDSKFFEGRNVDLQGIADSQLMELGIKAENIERHPDCPKCKSDVYWSYRADKTSALEGYRNVISIMLKKRATEE